LYWREFETGQLKGNRAQWAEPCGKTLGRFVVGAEKVYSLPPTIS
jgi:hypothetical protein